MEQKHMAGTASGAANHACTSLAELIASSVWWEAALCANSNMKMHSATVLDV